MKISKSIKKQIPPAVLQKVEGMEPINQEAFVAEFKRKMKSPMLCSLLELVGLHYAYVGKWVLTLAFWFTAGGLGIWFLIDLFRVGGMVREYNKSVALTVLKDIQVLA